jgi:predicted tellurium resistance membrane protein TerC
MFSQNDLRELKAISGKWFHSSKFFIMLIGVVVAPLVLFVIGGRSLNTLGEPSVVLASLAITLLLLISIGLGIRMFGRVARDLSISPKYI